MLFRDQEVDGSNPFAPTISLGSGPERSFTERSEDIVYTFGPIRFSNGSSTRVSRSKYPRSVNDLHPHEKLPGCGLVKKGFRSRMRQGSFASLVDSDLKNILVILEIRVVCKDEPAAS